MIVGTVTPDGSVSFAPVSASASGTNAIEPATYGNSATMNVHSTSFSIDSTTTPNIKVWSIGVGLRNLLAYPIGANQAATSTLDTSGVFVFFSSAPVVTLPAVCPGCTVTVTNNMGTSSFTASNQKFFWYYNRLQAMQGTPSTDTTRNNPIWKFTGPKAVTGFTFVLLISAAWPASNQAQSTVSYDGTADSFPNINAEPRRKVAGFNLGGSESWSSAGLSLATPSGNDAYFIRNDSLSATEPLLFDATFASNSATNGEPEVLFGFLDPKAYVIGVALDKVGFVTAAGLPWSFTGPTYTFPGPNGSASHHYRLRKYGSDSAVLCVDGGRVLKTTTAALVSSNITGALEIWGSGGQTGGATSTWTNASYSLGTAGSGCS